MNELLEKLCRFVGYGSQDAKVIFIGTEEKTKDDEDVKTYGKRLEIQKALPKFCDLGTLCKKLTEAGLFNPQDSKPQFTWAPLCSVMLGFNGKSKEMGHGSAILAYQVKELGKIDGDNLLAELLPVPKSSVNTFETHIHGHHLGIRAEGSTLGLDAYHEAVLSLRQEMFAKILRERFAKGHGSQPLLIVAYGRPWSRFEPIFPEIAPGQYASDPEGRFKWAEWNGCLFVLTYHPASEKHRFDIKVARRIVEIYHERLGNPEGPEHQGSNATQLIAGSLLNVRPARRRQVDR